ncbi:MAG: CoA transferase [Deltaproteobacteria bacterium]|nr:CoA transferase [Deltaproteobacteria bacterium]MBW2051162.1 CoA transferase [Deltaproteobacteria bacterium]MBW2140012.1 CoA transferase [Deltaproteobacteria bacterium]MBW2322334.1 CoA transferase [Deltaproteobacteria bacterium]
MDQALSGFKVIDFGHYIPGPYTAMMLAEQGAEVIKVERPGGDPYRGEPGFMVFNRSKKGITLDLKKEEGQRIAHELIKQADVVIANYRPGVTERLGIGYDRARELNPNLVYCSITGFGEEGPYRDRPGWDPIVASTVGIYVEQGGREDNPPTYLVLPLPSYYTAFMTSFSITTALLAREMTGKGQKVDISMFKTMITVAGSMLVDFEEKIRIPYSNPQGQAPVYKLYQGSDGKWFFMALGNLTFVSKFALAMGHDEWLVDPRFEGAPFLILPPINLELIEMFSEIFSTRTRDEWIEFLRAEDIPCAPALPIENYFDDPQVLANEMVVEIEEPGLGSVREMGVSINFSRTPGGVKGRSPKIGEHNEEVLTELLDCSAQEITGLKKREII